MGLRVILHRLPMAISLPCVIFFLLFFIFSKLSVEFSFMRFLEKEVLEILLTLIFLPSAMSLAEIFKRKKSTSKEQTKIFSFKLWFYNFLQYFFQWSFSLMMAFYLFSDLGPKSWVLKGSVLPASFAGGHSSVMVFLSGLNDESMREYFFQMGMFFAGLGMIFSLLVSAPTLLDKGHQHSLEGPALKDFKARYFFDTFLVLILAYLIRWPFGDRVALFALGLVIAFLLELLKGPHKKMINNDGHHSKLLHFQTQSNLSMDLLILMSFLLLNLEFIGSSALELMTIVLTIFGFNLLSFYVIAPLIFRDKEQCARYRVFTWGWSFGGIVVGLFLLKLKGPNQAQLMLKEYTPIYLTLVPLEVGLLFGVPYFLL